MRVFSEVGRSTPRRAPPGAVRRAGPGRDRNESESPVLVPGRPVACDESVLEMDPARSRYFGGSVETVRKSAVIKLSSSSLRSVLRRLSSCCKRISWSALE